jgi:hypothetical protein
MLPTGPVARHGSYGARSAARACRARVDRRAERTDRGIPRDLRPIVRLAIPSDDRSLGVPFVLPDGRALLATWQREAGTLRWDFFGGTDGTTAPLGRPPADPDRSAPILSDDGEWTAWIERVPGETVTPLVEQVMIRSLRDRREAVVRLPDPGRASLVLLGVDVPAQSVTLFAFEYRTSRAALAAIGFDGAPRGEPIVAEGVSPQATTMLRVGTGWVAWDAYRDQGRYRLAWALPRGRGVHEVRLGCGITAVDVDPQGTYVALSTTTNLNIGAIRDSVYVLRAADGGEAFRRFLPTYARSRVSFLGSGRLAYDDSDGGRSGVRIVRVPGGPG